MAHDEHPTAIALLDAVDEILTTEGASALSLRQVEVAANASHGSVRYHFGSFEGLLAAAFGRQNTEMVARQVEMYDSDLPMAQKWRIATREFFDADVASGWAQRMFEATHLAISHPEVRTVVRKQGDGWLELLRDAVEAADGEYGTGLSEQQVRGIAMTIGYSQFGAIATALQGGHPWHEDYLAVWDRLFDRLEKRREDEQ